MDFIIQTKNLFKEFSGKQIIRDVNLNIRKGEIYGLLGENGAGKTTIFKLLCGLINPTKGEIKILGMNMIIDKKEILGYIGVLIEEPVFYNHLTASENLEIHLKLMNKIKLLHLIPKVLKMVGLQQSRNIKVSQFSLGMKQRLAIARTLIHKPKILILDEPINGLDPKGIRDIRKILKKVVEKYNTTIIISSHILSELEKVSNKIGVISNGAIINEFSIKDLEDKNQSLEDYYFENIVGDISDECTNIN